MSGSASSDSGSSDGAWSAVAKGLLMESQADSEETQKCDACRSESAASSCWETETENPFHTTSSSSWWAQQVKIHAKPFGDSTMGRNCFFFCKINMTRLGLLSY